MGWPVDVSTAILLAVVCSAPVALVTLMRWDLVALVALVGVAALTFTLGAFVVSGLATADCAAVAFAAVAFDLVVVAEVGFAAVAFALAGRATVGFAVPDSSRTVFAAVAFTLDAFAPAGFMIARFAVVDVAAADPFALAGAAVTPFA